MNSEMRSPGRISGASSLEAPLLPTQTEKLSAEPDSLTLKLPMPPPKPVRRVFGHDLSWKRLFQRFYLLGLGPSNTRPKNKVVTAKYTLLSFLPKNLWEQCSLFTVYFLVIFVLTWIGNETEVFAATQNDPVTTLLGLIVVVAFVMVVDAYYDVLRHREDEKVNNRKAFRVRPSDGSLDEIPWRDVRPGDCLRVSDRQPFPADMLFLASAAGGKCYIETASIDGETNLKIRTIPPPLAAECRGDAAAAASIAGTLKCDLPNALLNFTGSLELNSASDTPVPLDFGNLLLRGAVLRNTPWVIGVVVYSGPETKMVQAAGTPPKKFSNLYHLVNRVILAMLLVDCVILCTVCAVLATYWYESDTSFWYLDASKQSYLLPDVVANWLYFVILYQGFVPIALLIAVTSANVVQSLYIGWDKDMYHKETDTAANARTMELAQEIGQISYVFSDKTGTLTRNEMKLVGCAVCGESFGVSEPNVSASDGFRTIFSRALRFTEGKRRICQQSNCDAGEESECEVANTIERFFTILAVCHTVLVNTLPGEAKYNAEGPDEEALVKAAAGVGFRLCSTDNGIHRIDREGRIFDYEILATNQFSSKRKRQSCVVRTPEGKLLLMCKGADNVIFERTLPPKSDVEISKMAQLQSHLDAFAEDGLRTLVLAERELDPKFYAGWKTRFDAASNSLGSARRTKLAAVAEEVEAELSIVGATAIEDRLQDGVPEALVSLRKAGIKTWVLTGDKVETAVNIAFSAGLLTSEMQLIRAVSARPGENLATLEEVRSLLTADNLKQKASSSNFVRTSSSHSRMLGGTQANSRTNGSREIAGAGMLGGSEDVFLDPPHQLALAIDDGIAQLGHGVSQLSQRVGGEVSQFGQKVGGEMADFGHKLGAVLHITPQLPHEESKRSSSSENVDCSDKYTDKAHGIMPSSYTASSPLSSSDLSPLPAPPPLSFSVTTPAAQTGILTSFVSSTETTQFDGEDGIRNDRQLLADDMERASCSSEAEHNRRTRAMSEMDDQALYSGAFETDNLALIISGPALEDLLSEQRGTAETESMLLSIAKLCTVVVACRMSPKQKALIVRMVRSGVKPEPITLAIGDGANDVAMIQEAKVGVGISGHEGMQAVNASDFSIAQFRFLLRLLLVHGRWNYRRSAMMILYIFYSNILNVLVTAFFNAYNNMSGSLLWFQVIGLLFAYEVNVPLVIVGCFNRDISDKTALAYPVMYASGRRNLNLTSYKIVEVILKTIVHAAIICFVTIAFAPSSVSWIIMGTAAYTSVCFVSLARGLLETFDWNVYTVAAYFVGILLIFAVEPIYYLGPYECTALCSGSAMWDASSLNSGNTQPKTPGAYLWLTVLLSTGSSLAWEIATMWLRRSYFPTLIDVIIEADRGYGGNIHEKDGENSALKAASKLMAALHMPMLLPKGAIRGALEASRTDKPRRSTVTGRAHRSSYAFDGPSDPDEEDDDDTGMHASLQRFGQRVFASFEALPGTVSSAATGVKQVPSSCKASSDFIIR